VTLEGVRREGSEILDSRAGRPSLEVLRYICATRLRECFPNISTAVHILVNVDCVSDRRKWRTSDNQSVTD